jgi:hypothetical protein
MVRPSPRDPFDALADANRSDVLMTIVGGVPAIAAPELAEVFVATRTDTIDACVDGSPRIVARWIGRRAAALRFPEPGFEVPAA